MKILDKLKKRWELKDNAQVGWVLLVFALTGSSAVTVKDYLFDWWNVYSLPWYYFLPVYIATVFPLYQVLLLSFGWLLGQFEFFWKFERKMLSRFGIGRKKRVQSNKEVITTAD